MGQVQEQDDPETTTTHERVRRRLAAVGAPDGQAPSVRVPLSHIKRADSPRLQGPDPAYVRILADIDGPLPPILVHRASMRVIDGMHRLDAAALRGQETIDVEFFDGTDEQAFVQSVKANVAHGLPLSLADRTAAARRIIRSFASWSDRAIAEIAGLAPTTVGAIRRAYTDVDEPASRIGRDGKLRPVNRDQGRRIAAEIIRNRPQTSLREVARRAGISPATARDVRARMERGKDPTLDSRDPVPVSGRADATLENLDALLQNLQRDPSLRFTDSGRTFLRWLSLHVVDAQEWHQIASELPPHCTYSVARLARKCSDDWLAFAEHLEQVGYHDRTA